MHHESNWRAGPRVRSAAMAILVLLFLVLPIVELYVIIRVGQEIGALYTIGLLLMISVVGAWLAKREGLGVWRRINQQVGAGQVPGAELVDAFLILLAGALLLTPGFITDVLAILLLIPPSRAVVRRTLRRRFMGRVEVFRGAAQPSRPPPPDIDV
jgi:UPF0716 protein FxsA